MKRCKRTAAAHSSLAAMGAVNCSASLGESPRHQTAPPALGVMSTTSSAASPSSASAQSTAKARGIGGHGLGELACVEPGGERGGAPTPSSDGVSGEGKQDLGEGGRICLEIAGDQGAESWRSTATGDQEIPGTTTASASALPTTDASGLAQGWWVNAWKSTLGREPGDFTPPMSGHGLPATASALPAAEASGLDQGLWVNAWKSTLGREPGVFAPPMSGSGL